MEIFRAEVWRSLHAGQQGKIHAIAVLVAVLAATLASPLWEGWGTAAGFAIGWLVGAEVALRVTQPSEERGSDGR